MICEPCATDASRFRNVPIVYDLSYSNMSLELVDYV